MQSSGKIHRVWGVSIAAVILIALFFFVRTQRGSTPGVDASLSGQWSMKARNGFEFTLTLAESGTTLKGAMSNSNGSEKIVGTRSGDNVFFARLSLNGDKPYQRYSGKIFKRDGVTMIEGVGYPIENEKQSVGWSAWKDSSVKK